MQVRLDDRKKGLIILESEPQLRTICSGSFVPNTTDFIRHRLAFPYMLTVIHYQQRDKKFVYNGLHDLGLSIFFMTQKLNSLSQIPKRSPFEHNGYVCTTHNYDGREFNDLPSLVNFVVDLYWGTIQYVTDDLLEFWKKLDTDSVLTFHW